MVLHETFSTQITVRKVSKSKSNNGQQLFDPDTGTERWWKENTTMKRNYKKEMSPVRKMHFMALKKHAVYRRV